MRGAAIRAAALLMSATYAGGGPTPLASPPADAAPTTNAPPPTGPATRPAEALFALGAELLAAGEHRAALEKFNAVLRLSPSMARAWHGIGLAFQGLGETARALEALERAYANGCRDRATCINLAGLQLSAGNPARGVVVLSGYLTAKPEAIDEPALNALAVCLSRTPRHLWQAPEYAAAVRLYEQRNRRLESKRPGERRWGVEWMAEDQARELYDELDLWRSKAAEVEAAIAELRDERARLMRQVEPQVGRSRPSQREIDAIQRDIARIEARIRAHEDELERIEAQATRPAFPRSFAMVGLNDLVPPEVTRPSSQTTEPQQPAPAQRPPWPHGGKRQPRPSAPPTTAAGARPAW